MGGRSRQEHQPERFNSLLCTSTPPVASSVLGRGGQVLAAGGTACVSDEGCGDGGSGTDRVPLAQLLPYHSYETLWCWLGGGKAMDRAVRWTAPLKDNAALPGMNG